MTLNAAQFIALNIFSKSFNITSGQKFLLQWFCKKWRSIIVIVRVSDCLSGGLGIFYFLVMLVILKYKQCQSYNDCDNDCRAHTISNSIEFMTVSAKLYCRDLGPEKCLIGWEARKKKKKKKIWQLVGSRGKTCLSLSRFLHVVLTCTLEHFVTTGLAFLVPHALQDVSLTCQPNQSSTISGQK